MAAHKTAEELLAELNDIDAAPASTPSRTKKPPAAVKPTAGPEGDELAELEKLTKVKPLSRPNTPKLSSTLASNRTRSPVRRTTDSGRNSEERQARRSAESGASSAPQGLTPTSEEEMAVQAENREHVVLQQQGGSGGWWGGLMGMASVAVKQAEGMVKEIQKNEEAQKWADQVRGNVGALKGLGRSSCVILYDMH
jgi:Family of unknown function (DUF5427)